MSESRRASTCSKMCKRSPGAICEKISHYCLRNTYSPERKHRKPQASPRIVVARLLIVSFALLKDLEMPTVISATINASITAQEVLEDLFNIDCTRTEFGLMPLKLALE